MVKKFDFLVIGSGIAGLSFALKVSPYGRIAIVTKKKDSESNTNYAQGGIASVIAETDSLEKHVRDTLAAGAGLCDRQVVERVVSAGPRAIRELIELGVGFSYRAKPRDLQNLDLGQEGGHSEKRVVHAADHTGREIENSLIEAVKNNPAITVMEDHIAVDLLTRRENGRTVVCGAWVYDERTANLVMILAGITLLATGGLGQVYLHTTNPAIATGDGVAMAYRAGAKIANLEFMQFHPTSLYHPDGRSFLISEAVRGEGAKLRLRDGRRFMPDYHPQAELATRDIVARAIDREIKLSGDPCVYLDLTQMRDEFIKERFPSIYTRLKGLGIDPAKEWVPVVPAAHYMCGGIVSDLEGKTSLENLYAVGEVAHTGMHGGNRLASNSLLEAVVFADFAAQVAKRQTTGAIAETDVTSEFSGNVDGQAPAIGEERVLISHAALDIKQIMWNYVGVVRSNRRLSWAKRRLDTVRADVDEIWRAFSLSYGLIELRNLVTVAELIVRCAIARKESRGLHFNLDYPAPDDTHGLRDTVVDKNTEG